MRAALYARYSTPRQNPGSTADQLGACRRYAGRLGARVIAEYGDAAASGASMANRPGLRAMLDASRRGAFDVLVTEGLDRLSRNESHLWTIFQDLTARKIVIHSLTEGPIHEDVVGLKGVLNAMLLRDIGAKTRRGLESAMRDGRRIGPRPFGYRIARGRDAQGAVLAGLTTIDEGEAQVVREIFRRYAAGQSPRTIAVQLNARGVAGPGGRAWKACSINGSAARGRGVLHNELYRGVLVFGRAAWRVDPDTGKRLARAVTPEKVERQETPELRIVSERLWAAAQARHAEVRRPQSAALPVQRPRLLSGLLRCGSCGGAMNLTGSPQRYRCSARIAFGSHACANPRTAPAAQVEARVAAALRPILLHPGAVEAAGQAFFDATDPFGDTKCQRTAAVYHQRIERLEATFEDLAASPHRDEARHALAGIVGAVRIVPRPGRGCYDLEIDGRRIATEAQLDPRASRANTYDNLY